MMVEGHEGYDDSDNSRSNVTSLSMSSPLGSVSAKKQPPPESKESLRVRGLVIGSFWAIIIFLGLPIWWWTTSIYRARLPLQEMLEWADGKVSVKELNDLYLCTTTNKLIYRHANPPFPCKLSLMLRRCKRPKRSIWCGRPSMLSMT